MADEGKVQLPLELDGMQLVAVCGRKAEKVQLPLDETVLLHLDETVQLADKVEKVQLHLDDRRFESIQHFFTVILC